MMLTELTCESLHVVRRCNFNDSISNRFVYCTETEEIQFIFHPLAFLLAQRTETHT